MKKEQYGVFLSQNHNLMGQAQLTNENSRSIKIKAEDKLERLSFITNLMGQSLLIKERNQGFWEQIGLREVRPYIAQPCEILLSMSQPFGPSPELYPHMFTITLHRKIVGSLIIDCNMGETIIKDFAEKFRNIVVKVPIKVFQGIADEDVAKAIDGLVPNVVDRNKSIEQVKNFYKLFWGLWLHSFRNQSHS